jgi:hypothetical protein
MTELDRQFLAQFRTPSPSADDSVLTATPEQMAQALARLVGAITLVRLPFLTPEQRRRMAGMLTPDHRLLLLALIEVFQEDPSFQQEVGCTAEDLQLLLDQDTELESFGAALSRQGQAAHSAEARQQGTLLALNHTVLLEVDRELSELDPVRDRARRDLLLSAFGPAFAAYQRMYPGKHKDQKDERPRTLKALREALEAATRDAAVHKAVSAIRAAAKLNQPQTL